MLVDAYYSPDIVIERRILVGAGDIRTILLCYILNCGKETAT